MEEGGRGGGVFRRGLSGVDLPRGVRGRARETCAIFHHYADTMVGLAGSYVLLFLLALLPTSPLIFLSSLLVPSVLCNAPDLRARVNTHARALFLHQLGTCSGFYIICLSFPLYMIHAFKIETVSCLVFITYHYLLYV